MFLDTQIRLLYIELTVLSILIIHIIFNLKAPFVFSPVSRTIHMLPSLHTLFRVLGQNWIFDTHPG